MALFASILLVFLRTCILTLGDSTDLESNYSVTSTETTTNNDSLCGAVVMEIISNKASGSINKYTESCSYSDIVATLAHNLVYNLDTSSLDNELLSNLITNFNSEMSNNNIYPGDQSILSILNQIRDNISYTIEDLKRRLVKVDNILNGFKDSNNVETDTLENWMIVKPAISWAQASDAVFLNIKFSKHMSSPGASIPENDVSVDVTNKSVFINAYQRDMNKLYQVDIPLSDNVVPHSKQLSIGSVGRVQITLEKESHVPWTRLIDDTIWEGGKVNFWFDLAERYEYGSQPYFTERTINPPLVKNNTTDEL